MPSENGETQHETSENQGEEDRRDDSLERAIKDLQDSLNQSEEPVDTKSDEEDGGEDNLGRAIKDLQDSLNQPEELAESKSEEGDSGEDSLERAIKDLQDSLNQPEEPLEIKPEEEDIGEGNPECWLREYQDAFNQLEEPVERKSEEDSIVEKYQEKAEYPDGHDGGEDSLERAIRDLQNSLNQSEPAEWKLEEESIVPTDGFDGKVTEAHEIEVKSSENENPTRLTTGGEHATIYENQETDEKSTTNNRDFPEVPDKEEHKAEGDKESHLIKEEIQFLHHGGKSLNQDEEGSESKEQRHNKTTGEPQPTFDQHQGNIEHNRHRETLANEYPETNQDKESETRIKQDTSCQEVEQTSVKLGDDPKAFVEANLELLVKEGITVGNNEAKLAEKTTLRLDEKEGVTIIHGDQHYKITQVETEKIGDMELNRYRTRQGEEFLHIPKEDVMIPPYETSWYALPTNTRIYLNNDYKHELIEATIEKAGGKREARQVLGERGIQINREYLVNHLHDADRGIRSDRLIPILTYVQRDLNEPNKYIKAIGTHEAVENPNLPFKLNNIDGSRIEAARFSDGTLPEFKGRGPRFLYYNSDTEQRTRIEQSLKNIFGSANIINREYADGRVARVRPTTEVIGHVLLRAGGMAGDVARKNPDIPTFIMQGSKEMKREWLRQVFGDEGSPDSTHKSVTLSRAVDATHTLSDEQKTRLDEVSKEWNRKSFPDGVREQNRYHAFGDLDDDIQTALMHERSRLLDSEARLLQDDFGIETHSSASQVCRRADGGYSVTWTMETTSREGSRAFYEEIGFPQNRKQEKLREALGIKDTGNH
jgi:hypothetical protein